MPALFLYPYAHFTVLQSSGRNYHSLGVIKINKHKEIHAFITLNIGLLFVDILQDKDEVFYLCFF